MPAHLIVDTLLDGTDLYEGRRRAFQTRDAARSQ
jgi:hypothetical protein